MQALSLNANCELVSSAQGKACLQDKGTWTQVSKTQWGPQRPNPGEQKTSGRGELVPLREHCVVISEQGYLYAVWSGHPTQKDQCLLQAQTRSPELELEQAMPGAL